MTGKIQNQAKQYIVVIIATLVVVLLYMKCYYSGNNSFISIDMDKPVDQFIANLLQESEAGNRLSLSLCEYNIQNMIILLFCKISGSVYQGVNAYYVLSFFLISISVFWYLRKLKISAGIAAYGAVLASLLPFHIDRGEGQIITSTFFLVPIFAGIWYEVVYEEKSANLNKGYLIIMCIAPFIDRSCAVTDYF